MRKLLLMLCVAAPIFGAVPAVKVLIIRPAEGKAARAVVGDTKVTARSITCDAGSNELLCEGGVEVHTADAVATGDRIHIKLQPGTPIYYLNEKGIEINASEPAPTPSAAQQSQRP